MRHWRKYHYFHRFVWFSNPFLRTLYDKPDPLHLQLKSLKLRLRSPQSNDKKRSRPFPSNVVRTSRVHLWRGKKVFRGHTFCHFKKFFFCFVRYKGMSSDEVFLLHLVSPKHELRITQVVIRATRINLYIFMAILIITTIQPTAPLLKTD